MNEPTVAVVLTGAAARGAFQAGALSVVIPALQEQGLRPTIYLGTSAGAINASLWGSLAHLPADQAASQLLQVWQMMDGRDIYGYPGLTLLTDGLRLLPGAILGVGAGLPSLLDTGPLLKAGEEYLNGEQLHANVQSGVIDAIGVAATRVPPAVATGDPQAPHWHIAHSSTVLFLDTTLDAQYVADPARALRVAQGPVHADQVLASSAIPVVFPAVEVDTPAGYEGWYVDGGVRLNAPLRPAVDLGADHIVVIAAHATQYPPDFPNVVGPRPDIADTGAMVLHSVLADHVICDLQDIRTRNRWLADGVEATTSAGRPYRPVQLLEISPEPGTLAELAQATLDAKAGWRDPSALAVQRLLRGVGDGPGTQELLSYAYFDSEYFTAQIALGEAAAWQALDAGWSL